MPVRNIPRNYRTPTGLFPSLKDGRGVQYESPLERDFYNILEFYDDVLTYEEQPVEIPHKVGNRYAPFYPDCLITYQPESGKRPQLTDIKSTDDINANIGKFAIRRAIVSRYAKERGWDYAIYTEKEIRTVYLENIKFLYANARPPARLSEVIQLLKNTPGAHYPLTVAELISVLSPDENKQLEILPNIWHLIWAKKIHTDLQKKLTMSSIVKVDNGWIAE